MMNSINKARKRLAQAEDEIRKDQDRQSAAMSIDELITDAEDWIDSLKYENQPYRVELLFGLVTALREQQARIDEQSAQFSKKQAEWWDKEDKLQARIEEITVLLEKRSKRIRF